MNAEPLISWPIAVRRSASAGLALAGAVLVVTAVLVSLPTPK